MEQRIVDEVRYSKAARKFLKTRSTADRMRIKHIIETDLKCVPAKGDIKPLAGYSDGRRRLRIGSIRIIFRYDNEGRLLILNVLNIGNRGDIYKS
jgi:mRNA interferase RelE/StbE